MSHGPLTRQVIVEGVGLHTGSPVRVALHGCAGPVQLRGKGVAVTLDELSVVSTRRATTVQARGGGLRTRTVEHALAALAGLGVYEGVALQIDGPEMPLLDGGAMAWCDAVKQLGVEAGRPRLRVARRAVIYVGASRYEWAPADAVDVEVRLEIDDARLTLHARWAGDPDDFYGRIAPARTFAVSGEIEELLRQGLARHVDPASVVVIAPDAIHHAGRPFSPDEPARHKLLDLVGDLYLYGGPPLGRVSALRPGHAANTRAILQARDAGVLVDR
jgi:UDP-3-O-[3-hydroxymyristoyl] N-acetylglucosamine deacetylase